ncbi:MAG: hypothetical protein HC866_09410 [Leptolyngbyaceae cyanobacterium RU_5_1]|nr:hypothetical protein [Leptolyngbyaceae cyanobacterium RU_5_1]
MSISVRRTHVDSRANVFSKTVAILSSLLNCDRPLNPTVALLSLNQTTLKRDRFSRNAIALQERRSLSP